MIFGKANEHYGQLLLSSAEALPLDCQRAFDLGRRLAGAETVAA